MFNPSLNIHSHLSCSLLPLQLILLQILHLQLTVFNSYPKVKLDRGLSPNILSKINCVCVKKSLGFWRRSAIWKKILGFLKAYLRVRIWGVYFWILSSSECCPFCHWCTFTLPIIYFCSSSRGTHSYFRWINLHLFVLCIKRKTQCSNFLNFHSNHLLTGFYVSIKAKSKYLSK